MDDEYKGSITSYILQCDRTETHKIAATFARKTAYGDINQDNDVDMKDAILALRVLVGAATPTLTLQKKDDINGDGRIGMEEVIYILHGLQAGNDSGANLEDAISVLNLISGRNGDEITVCADLNRNGKIGTEEVL